MDLRGSLYKLRKKVKHLGSQCKSDRLVADIDAESVNPGNSLLEPESHIVAGDGEGS